LELARQSSPAGPAAAYGDAISKYRTLALEQSSKKDALKAQADKDQETYDSLNYRDDQFDLSDALIAIAIAMLAVTALTRLWALYWVSLLPTGFGVLMGVAGLAGLPIHPGLLVKLLS
jgi:hypothetical protein